MKDFKGTKGGWYAQISGYGDYIDVRTENGIAKSNNKCLINWAFKPDDSQSEYYKEQKANAKLISAAPDLLEALNELYEMVAIEKEVPLPITTHEKWQLAIKKALG